MSRIVSSLLGFTAAAALASCSGYVTPEPSYQTIWDTLQSAAESISAQIISTNTYLGIDDNLNNVYQSYSATQFETVNSTGPNHAFGYIPPPASACGVPAGQWPPIDTCANFYYDYASAHRDLSWPFGAFGANHLFGTDTTSCNPNWHGGVSDAPDPANIHTFNSIPTDRSRRWSFVFVADADAVARRCARDQRNTMTFLYAHELGHQIAGLSDNTTNLQGINTQALYHRGKLPSGRTDAMVSPIDIVIASANALPVFDAYDSVLTNDTTSCMGNLIRSRSFTH